MVVLLPAFDPALDNYEIGVDEAGRGPMFGRVYAAAVILPKDPRLFKHELMKDSKKFHSEKKIKAAAQYIQDHAIAWAVAYQDEKVIDEINIRQATLKAMHDAIKEVMATCKPLKKAFHILVDGNDFKMMTVISTTGAAGTGTGTTGPVHFAAVPHTCIEGGDNTYSSIAAASILAKVGRDTYIEELCLADPELVQRYDLLKNKGYGTAKHMAGIQEYGITPQHRQTFGICKTFAS